MVQHCFHRGFIMEQYFLVVHKFTHKWNFRLYNEFHCIGTLDFNSLFCSVQLSNSFNPLETISILSHHSHQPWGGSDCHEFYIVSNWWEFKRIWSWWEFQWMKIFKAQKENKPDSINEVSMHIMKKTWWLIWAMRILMRILTDEIFQTQQKKTNVHIDVIINVGRVYFRI